jgi:formate dehydrogenase major subunit
MVRGAAALSRREFLRASTAGGFAVGGLLGFGMDLRAAHEKMGRLKIANAREVPSVCPYCAVGCGQIVSVRNHQIINIEGNPESPISRGTLCPKGAATFQLAVNEKRLKHVWYRRPNGKEWERKTLDWAMDRIAELTKKTRDETFQEFWTDPEGKQKRVSHTRAIASLGGATMDNEWNYIQCKLLRALGVIFLENQARI